MSRIDVTASGSPITVTASDSQINATVGPAPSFTVDVSGGQGPQGPAGPQGEPGDDAALPPGTEGYVLTYVGGEWVAAEPSGGGGGVPSAHASSHQPGGHDELYNQSLNTTDVPTFDGLVIAGTFPALQIAETVGLYYDSTAGYWLLDCGDEEHQGVISRFSLMNCEEIAFLDESVQTTAWTGAVAAESVTGLATVATTGSYDDLDDLPTLFDGKFASLTSTPTSLSGYGITDAVASNDARLTDARTPTAHTHTASAITDFATAVAAAAPAYSLPAASASVLGGVKVGSGLSIDGSSVLSATYSYTLPNATTSTLGGVIVGAGLSVAAGTISVVTYAVRSDTVSNVSFIGRALSGSATSASVWTIRRTTVASAGTVTTATATNVKWDDRLTASYS